MVAQTSSQTTSPQTDAGLFNRTQNLARSQKSQPYQNDFASGTPMPARQNTSKNDIAIGTPLPLNLRGNQGASPQQTQPTTPQGQFNQAQNLARTGQASDEEKEKKGNQKAQAAQKQSLLKRAKNYLSNPSNVSREILRWAWLSAIETYGLTLLYVWFHFIMHYVAGAKNYFSPFGSIMYIKMKGVSIGNSKVAEYAEVVAAIGLFIAFVSAIFFNLTFITAIIFIFMNKYIAAWEILKSFLSYFVS